MPYGGRRWFNNSNLLLSYTVSCEELDPAIPWREWGSWHSQKLLSAVQRAFSSQWVLARRSQQQTKYNIVQMVVLGNASGIESISYLSSSALAGHRSSTEASRMGIIEPNSVLETNNSRRIPRRKEGGGGGAMIDTKSTDSYAVCHTGILVCYILPM